MNRVDHADENTAQIDRAALVKAHGLDSFGFGPKAHQVVLSGHRYPQFLGQRQHIRHMVEMGMGEQKMRGACDGRLMPIFRQHRVPREPRVDQQYLPFGFNTKAAMAEPDDFHESLLSIRRR